jgi:hypothetical protein
MVRHVGTSVGTGVGATVGTGVGATVGAAVGWAGACVGAAVGAQAESKNAAHRARVKKLNNDLRFIAVLLVLPNLLLIQTSVSASLFSAHLLASEIHSVP